MLIVSATPGVEMNMDMQLRIALLLILLTGCSSSGQSKPVWESAPGVDIPAFSTFGWVNEITASPNTILETRITAALRDGLLKKGYVDTAVSPDILVSYEIMEREVAKQGSPIRLGVGLGSYGGNVGGSVGSSVDVGGKGGVQQQNQLTVRALDPETRKEAWIGTTATFGPQPETAVIDRVVSGVLKGFPEKRL